MARVATLHSSQTRHALSALRPLHMCHSEFTCAPVSGCASGFRLTLNTLFCHTVSMSLSKSQSNYFQTNSCDKGFKKPEQPVFIVSSLQDLQRFAAMWGPRQVLFMFHECSVTFSILYLTVLSRNLGVSVSPMELEIAHYHDEFIIPSTFHRPQLPLPFQTFDFQLFHGQHEPSKLAWVGKLLSLSSSSERLAPL